MNVVLWFLVVVIHGVFEIKCYNGVSFITNGTKLQTYSPKTNIYFEKSEKTRTNPYSATTKEDLMKNQNWGGKGMQNMWSNVYDTSVTPRTTKSKKDDIIPNNLSTPLSLDSGVFSSTKEENMSDNVDNTENKYKLDTHRNEISVDLNPKLKAKEVFATDKDDQDNRVIGSDLEDVESILFPTKINTNQSIGLPNARTRTTHHLQNKIHEETSNTQDVSSTNENVNEETETQPENTLETIFSTATELTSVYSEEISNDETVGITETVSTSSELSSFTAPNNTISIEFFDELLEADCFPVPSVTFTTIDPSDFNVTLEWESPISSCTFEYEISINDGQTVNTHDTQITIKELNACSVYNVSIKAYYNNSNPGPETTESFNTTTPEEFHSTVTNLTIVRSPENELEVSWKPPPEEYASCVTSYVVEWWDDNDTTIATEDRNLDVSITSYNIQLVGCAAYGIQVYPKVGDNNGNNVLKYYAVEPLPTNASILTHSQDKTHVNITWQTDDRTINRCTLDKIVVSCEALPNENSDFSWIIQTAGNEEDISGNSGNFRFTISVDDLSPFTNYTCEGVVTNEGGNSSVTTLKFQTDEDVPSQPRSVNIVNVTSNSFTIQWTEPEKVPGVMEFYQLSIENEGPLHFPQKECVNNASSHFFEIPSENNSFDFEDAVPYYKYSVLIYGVDRAGNGSIAEGEATTASAEPDPVANARMEPPVYSNSETYHGTAKVQFDPPCNTNGPFKNYNITYNGVRDGFENDTQNVPTNATIFEINLLPDRDYEITITVVTESFTSAPVPLPTFHSLPGVPGAIGAMAPPKSNDTHTAIFTLDKNVFDTSNGEILAYALILCSGSQCNGNGYDFWDGTEETWPKIPTNSRQLTPNLWNPFRDLEGLNSWEFKIGGDSNCSGNYCNKALDENTEYSLMVRALTNAAYRDSSLLKFKTQMPNDSLDLALILGLTFGLLTFVVLIIFIVFLWRKKRKAKLPDEEQRNSTSVPAPVPVQKFTNHYVGVKENYTIIKQQFSDLGVKSKDIAGETTFALLPENRRKNRYTNILPYDATRVTLNIDEDDEISSDFINASYIKGYSGKIEYIATQGPLESTVRDFWKMILQENVSLIVMVSQFIEQSKEKCYQYFPNNHESVYFGESLEVKCLTELHFGTYCIRTLQVRRGTEQRDVVHMQFLEWPDFGVPQGTDNMLQFCHEMREKANKDGGLIVVHCSAGVGRTGTLIALDILLQAIHDHRDINIYKTVLDLRKQRINMVQTEKQFMFIHTCIKDHLEAPTIPASDNKEERIYENVDVLKSSLKKNLIESELESAL